MKSKFVVTPPANVTETLLNKNSILCSKKEIPVQYGGNERDEDTKFSNVAVSEVVVKPGSSVNIEIPASQEQGETKAFEDDTQSSKVFVKLITGAK
ncbi:BnaC09g40150D [Brassica napus]|uniref:BnaC09g40150D protein n=1 Tax=Brassica napus TaxID=3708 RepID=A0A078FWU4_BRANA|nr:BnaC09g40150D [Brassica napus]